MSDFHDRLDRASRTASPKPDALKRLRKRRERRDRRERVTAVVAGLTVTAMLVGGGITILNRRGPDSDITPAGSTTATEPDLYFPTTQHGPSGDAALSGGPIVERDGCVFLGGTQAPYVLPVWPKGFTAESDESGAVVVRDDKGQIIAIEGKPFDMGGGMTAEFSPADKVDPRSEQLQRLSDWLGYEIPERCLGPEVDGVWVVGETHPLASALPYLATLARNPKVRMDAMGYGPLVVQNGCVVVDGPQDGTLVVWPPDYHLEQSGGQTELINGAGRTLAILGAETSFGGGYIPWNSKSEVGGFPESLAEPIPEGCRFSQVFFGWYE